MTRGSHASPAHHGLHGLHGHQGGPTQYGQHEPPEEPRESRTRRLVRRLAEQLHPDNRRRTAWRVGTPLVVLVCGGLLAISGENSEGTDLRPGRYTDMATLVQNESDSYKALERQVGAVTDEVQSLANSVPGAEVRSYQRKVTRLQDPAGLAPRSGPGVEIVLSDAPADKIDQADANSAPLFLVHQQDIQAVVNALWRGGASAVTIQGKRIITTTGIKCSGSTVQLGGVPYPQPYVIRAVGSPNVLSAAIDNDPDVALFRADAANPAIGLGWRFSVESQVTAPAYDGVLSLRYAKPLQ